MVFEEETRLVLKGKINGMGIISLERRAPELGVVDCRVGAVKTLL